MKKPDPQVKSLRDHLGTPADCAGRFLWGAKSNASLSTILTHTGLGGRLAEFSGRSVLIATHDQLTAALALIELDGIARRLVICPPDLSSEHLPEVIRKAGVNAVVTDYDFQCPAQADVSLLQAQISPVLKPAGSSEIDRYETEWLMLTSGTTGAPKLLAHTLAGLTGAIKSNHQQEDVIWGTFYDIRRYGGMQIFLRAIVGRRSLILSSADESPQDHLLRLGAYSVTHLTGTPSHWRRAVMSPSLRAIAPRYLRLSGEVADQAILNTLRSLFPNAAVGHAFASTEAGVGFEVNDGLEGFPASILGKHGDVEVKIEDHSIRIRSSRRAVRYIGEDNTVLFDNDDFVDTGDVVELRDDRYYFLGRRSGVINVGGLKVYPEEVEALINRHPAVSVSCVRSKRNAITGSLVVADVVLKTESGSGNPDFAELKSGILKICRDTLPRHKIPVALNFVPALAVAATGKLVRHSA